MFDIWSAAHAGSLRFARFACLAGVIAFTGCATHYIDGSTKEVAAASFRKPAEPKPVQLLFEFQTKGALNTRATDFLKAQVTEQVKGSGLFASVDDKPVAGGGLLSVTLNNVPLTDDAFTKGFVTGFTFGLVGSQVSDGYVCTVKYAAAQQNDMIVKTARHAIHTAMGAKDAPPNS
ncbi:MAG TPA: hypothetical protein VFA35_06340, partial [Burkholderiaceae bacterium]|nr:hypothetical protein [Burkholderiaceae bacterium]